MKTLDEVMATLSSHRRRMIEHRAMTLKQMAKRLRRIRKNVALRYK